MTTARRRSKQEVKRLSLDGHASHEQLLSIDCSGAARVDRVMLAVGVQKSCTGVVAEVGAKDFLHQILAERRIENGTQAFDAAVEITLHEVGAADVDLGVAAVLECIHARMFEKPSDDGSHS